MFLTSNNKLRWCGTAPELYYWLEQGMPVNTNQWHLHSLPTSPKVYIQNKNKNKVKLITSFFLLFAYVLKRS
jgi:hypothetical protein